MNKMNIFPIAPMLLMNLFYMKTKRFAIVNCQIVKMLCFPRPACGRFCEKVKYSRKNRTTQRETRESASLHDPANFIILFLSHKIRPLQARAGLRPD